jgi:hypothetical protein
MGEIFNAPITGTTTIWEDIYRLFLERIGQRKYQTHWLEVALL